MADADGNGAVRCHRHDAQHRLHLARHRSDNGVLPVPRTSGSRFHLRLPVADRVWHRRFYHRSGHPPDVFRQTWFRQRSMDEIPILYILPPAPDGDLVLSPL